MINLKKKQRKGEINPGADVCVFSGACLSVASGCDATRSLDGAARVSAPLRLHRLRRRDPSGGRQEGETIRQLIRRG